MRRFTDTEKWDDPWFMDLPSKYKLFWIYICDSCDCAGIWKVNFRNAQHFIGEHLEPSETQRMFKDRIKPLGDEYWFIEKFIKFQYSTDINELNPSSTVHRGVLKRLSLHKGFQKPFERVKDKDKDKDKVIGVVKGRCSVDECQAYLEEKYPDVLTHEEIKLEAQKFHSYYESNGWKVGKNPMKNWKSALSGWILRNKKDGQIGRDSKSDFKKSLDTNF